MAKTNKLECQQTYMVMQENQEREKNLSSYTYREKEGDEEKEEREC